MFLRYILKITKNTGFMVFCIITILIFSTLILNNIEKSKNSIKELNNELTSNYINIDFNDKIANEDIIKYINQIEKENNVIIKYHYKFGFDFDSYSEGIFFSDEFNYSYKLLEGRFFTKDDFISNKRIAVIGKDNINYTILENGTRYILRGFDKYEVIGIIGRNDIASRYDNIILYNLNSILNGSELLSKNSWIIDSQTKQENHLESIINKINSKGDINIFKAMDAYPNPLSQAILENKNLIICFVSILISALITFIRTILFWFESIKIEIGIRKEYGATNMELIIYITKRYAIIALISIIISAVVNFLMFKFNFLELITYNTLFENILFSIVIIILLGIVLITLYIKKLNTIPISVLLKEK